MTGFQELHAITLYISPFDPNDIVLAPTLGVTLRTCKATSRVGSIGWPGFYEG